jgi:hypothetical protein
LTNSKTSSQNETLQSQKLVVKFIKGVAFAIIYFPTQDTLNYIEQIIGNPVTVNSDIPDKT